MRIKRWIKSWKEGIEELGNQFISFKQNKKLYLEMGRELRRDYDHKREIKKEQRRNKNGIKKD